MGLEDGGGTTPIKPSPFASGQPGLSERQAARGSGLGAIQQWEASTAAGREADEAARSDIEDQNYRDWRVQQYADAAGGSTSGGRRSSGGGGGGGGGSGGSVLDAGAGLPTGSRLITVGGEYRVLWDLLDGLGVAWYDTDAEQLEKVMGAGFAGKVEQNYPTEEAFLASDSTLIFWGNLAEIDITSEDPWDDLKGKIMDSFGPVAGLDTPEIKQLVMQGYFESWGTNEFLAHYKQTTYYQTTTDAQREWITLSEEEQNQRVVNQADELLGLYRNHWGTDPASGIENENLLAEAQKIQSGTYTIGEWEFATRKQAETVLGTPAQISFRAQIQSSGQETTDRENLAANVEEAWRDWVGPTDVPVGMAEQWSNDLFLNLASAADFEGYLKGVSAGRWANKDPDVSWRDWAAPWVAEIGATLELGTVEDGDPLLRNILDNGLVGQEAVAAIRGDARFKQTIRMRDELQGAVSDVGRKFGFIT